MAADPYKYFRIEARELLEQLGRDVLELEQQGASPELLSRMLRLAHTLKGAARVVKQIEIAEISHAMEDTLAPLRDGGGSASRAQIEQLLGQLDRMTAAVDALAPAPPPAAVSEGAGPVRPAADEAIRATRVDADELESLFDAIAEVSTQLGALRHSLDEVDAAARAAGQLAAQLARVRASRSPLPANVDATAAGIVGTLVDAQREARGSAERMTRELGQLRETAERLRLVPARTLFAGLERIARDGAQAAGRRVRLEASGGDVRLDGHVLGVIQPALVQLVRNAVAHGIEPEAERRRAGKPLEGRIRLEVERRGNRIAFACADDGRGIDVEAVRLLAERRAGEPVSTSDLFTLLLRAGSTSAASVTQLAGRGVGLDVVRDAATRLGGVVQARTEAQRGTTIELVVPVTMSSVAALLVEAEGITAAIPLDAVHHSTRVRAAEISTTASGQTLLDGDDVIAFLPLGAVLDGGAGPSHARASWSSVVISHGDVRAAIGVDRLLGTASVLLRPLPALTPATAAVAGLALDEAGDPRLVLDPAGLIEIATRPSTAPRGVARGPRDPILVIDDSLTTRMLERAILESAGYEVALAVSAEDGLARAREQRFSLFLVDVEMPGIDGFTFVERTRADPDLRSVPAILVTSRDAPEDRERGRAAGASAYVVKGEFDQNALLRTIAKLIGGS